MYKIGDTVILSIGSKIQGVYSISSFHQDMIGETSVKLKHKAGYFYLQDLKPISVIKESLITLLEVEGLTKKEVCEKLEISNPVLNSLLENIYPNGYENPREIIISRFGVNDQRAEAMSIAKILYKKFPSLDFWKKVNINNLQSIRQLATDYATQELIPEKWRDFHFIPPTTKNDNIILSKTKIGEDYEITKTKNTKNLFKL